GLGAVVSACCLFLALSQWEDVFGLPGSVLWMLAVMAAVFAVYSISSYFVSGKDWRVYLWLILIANAVYGLLTLCLVLIYFNTITGLGLAYFVLELVVLSALVYIEGKSLGAGFVD
ncbi:MAG: hypothetical protein AAF840_10815, partial [Bacteroidota bacterium]